MKLLVTGGLGFIGLNYVLANHDKHEITVIDKQTYASNPVSYLPENVEFIHADIRSVNKLSIPNDFDWIVHFAAESHVDNALIDATPFWESNVQGTYELTVFALNHKIKFFHISTDEVFGEWKEGEKFFTEKSAYLPNNMYSISKATSDKIVCTQNRNHGLEYIITNCGNNYGSYQHPEKFIPKVLTGKVTLHAGGKAVRDWIYVGDHVKAIEKAMNGPINEQYVVSSRDAMTIQEVCELAGCEFDYGDNRPGVDVGYRLNPLKLERLGWRPEMRLEQWLKS